MDPVVHLVINVFFSVFFVYRGMVRYKEGSAGWALALLIAALVMGVCAILRAVQIWG